MEQLARALLQKLLTDAEKASAGRRIRPSVLTKSNLVEYHDYPTMQGKEKFETVMHAARAVGAIIISSADHGVEEGFINRIEIADARALASFLGRVPVEDLLAQAKILLGPFVERFPVVADVLAHWEQLRSVRTFTAADAQDWVDAIQVIDFAKKNNADGVISVPINEASGKIFKDTKRIKNLAAPIDVLLLGNIHADSRPAGEVWEEIGMFREEHPVRLAGSVMLERDRSTGYVDKPYIGLPADTIIQLASKPLLVMSIENQTTFHSEARRRCDENVLLIYTAGMPNPPWRSMYARLLKSLPADVPVYHWGDLDEGGFRIASVLVKVAKEAGHAIEPWQMHPDNVPEEHRSPASANTISKMVYFAKAAGWHSLSEAVKEAGFTVEQESLA